MEFIGYTINLLTIFVLLVFKKYIDKDKEHIFQEVASKQKSHLLVSVSIEDDTLPESTPNQQRQAQTARELAFEHDMLLERESRIKEIESDILDVNQIMRELGSLVHAQGETIGKVWIF